MHTFSIRESYSFAWGVFKKNLGFILLLLLITIAVSIAVSLIGGMITSQFEDNQLLAFLITLPLYLIQYVITLGEVKIILDLIDSKKPNLSDLYSQYPYLLSYIAATIIFTILMMVGFILLIIPGIIIALMFQFYTYVIVDKKVGPIEALKESKKITQGNRWKLFLYALSTIGLCIIGILALIVGVFVAVAVIMITTAYIYRKLETAGSQVAAPQPTQVTATKPASDQPNPAPTK